MDEGELKEGSNPLIKSKKADVGERLLSLNWLL